MRKTKEEGIRIEYEVEQFSNMIVKKEKRETKVEKEADFMENYLEEDRHNDYYEVRLW